MATYTRESSSAGWVVGIIVAAALLTIGYFVFSANGGPNTELRAPLETLDSSSVNFNNGVLVYKRADGTCITYVRTSQLYVWYTKIDCPGD